MAVLNVLAKSPVQTVVITSVMFITLAGHVACGQGPNARTRSAGELVESLNRNTDVAIQEADAIWRREFKAMRARDKLSALAGYLVSFTQKLDLADDFFSDGSNAKAGVRKAFRREIADEQAVIRAMKSYATETLAGLAAQDRMVMQAMGVSSSERGGLCVDSLETATWNRPFEGFFDQAVKLSQNDIGRTFATFAGSNIVSDAITDSARSSGANPFAEGSLEDFVADLLINIAVGVAADAATDPTDTVRERLDTELRAVERQLLDGPDGLITSLRAAADRHKQARLRLIKNPLGNGGQR